MSVSVLTTINFRSDSNCQGYVSQGRMGKNKEKVVWRQKCQTCFTLARHSHTSNTSRHCILKSRIKAEKERNRRLVTKVSKYGRCIIVHLIVGKQHILGK